MAAPGGAGVESPLAPVAGGRYGILVPECTDAARSERHQMGEMARRTREGRLGAC